MATSPLVRINGLTKTFGEGDTRVDAVRDLDLELARGEIVLVMGPSGSGKTTFLSMLGGLLRVSAGEIWIDGTDIAVDVGGAESFRFDTRVSAWIAFACRVAGRNLTTDEWTAAFGEEPYRETCSLS